LVTKKPPVVRAALCVYLGVCYFFTLTGAILTTIRSLIIRTARTTTIREREKIGLISALGISPDYRPIQE
jgi:hypothetical protein